MNTDILWELTSVTEGSSATLTSSLSYEMSTNFSVGPVSIGSTTTISFADKWLISESATWNESIETSESVQVPPMKKVLVSQLVGTYGPLTVKSNSTTF